MLSRLILGLLVKKKRKCSNVELFLGLDQLGKTRYLSNQIRD